MREAHSQAPKARLWNDCDQVCFALIAAIQERPDLLVMRLEDALVIREACAGEIVNAAINAVGREPALVDKIVKTALHVAPRRSSSILYAANHFTPVAPVAIAALDEEEIRRAELPAGARAAPTEEIRRAEVPGVANTKPVPEVRRAIRIATLLPEVEIRRAEIPQRIAGFGPAPFTLTRRVQPVERRR